MHRTPVQSGFWPHYPAVERQQFMRRTVVLMPILMLLTGCSGTIERDEDDLPDFCYDDCVVPADIPKTEDTPKGSKRYESGVRTVYPRNHYAQSHAQGWHRFLTDYAASRELSEKDIDRHVAGTPARTRGFAAGYRDCKKEVRDFEKLLGQKRALEIVAKALNNEEWDDLLRPRPDK